MKRLIHNKSKTKIYYVWCAMHERCSKTNSKKYKFYGARGIKVCARWDNFLNFTSDMGERPAGMTIERIHNDKDYSPENCRWASRKDQARNTRKTLFLTHNGETHCLSEWAEKLGIRPRTLWARTKAGWTADQIFYPGTVHRRSNMHVGGK